MHLSPARHRGFWGLRPIFALLGTLLAGEPLAASAQTLPPVRKPVANNKARTLLEKGTGPNQSPGV
jgi:hypothetical protein